MALTALLIEPSPQQLQTKGSHVPCQASTPSHRQKKNKILSVALGQIADAGVHVCIVQFPGVN